MKIFLTLLAMVAYVSADDFDLEDAEADPRLFFANFTSSLVAVNTTLLSYGLIILAIMGAGAVALYYFYLESQAASSRFSSTGSEYSTYNYARSADDGYDFNGFKIIQWITMLQDFYEKFEYNKLDCQKKLICEVMAEPESYGSVAKKFKSGFEYARYLQVLPLPDNMRALLDEYLDANSRADQQENCDNFYECPYSIKETVKNNLGNDDFENYGDYEVAEGAARFLYFNSSSTGTGITLLGAVILLGVIGYLIFVGGYLDTSSASNRNDFYNQEQYQDPAYDAYYRSANDDFSFDALNVISWISMLQDIYEKFDYNDLDCQKKLICEVMREPEYYNADAQQLESGFQYVKHLEVLPLPDGLRELLDEYLDADATAKQQKSCEEFFQCPYSIKDSVKRNLSGNSL